MKMSVTENNYNIQADGDLGFNAGDRIEVVERTSSAEDWWTGKINGRQGVFPGKQKTLTYGVMRVCNHLSGNYVQET